MLCETCQAGAGHTAAVRQTRGRAIAARKRALKERVAAFGADVDPAIYRERIWPKLASCEARRHHGGHGLQQGPLLDDPRVPGRLDIPRLDLSSGLVDFLFGPMCPGDVLVVDAVVVEAAMKDADETVPEGA